MQSLTLKCYRPLETDHWGRMYTRFRIIAVLIIFMSFFACSSLALGVACDHFSLAFKGTFAVERWKVEHLFGQAPKSWGLEQSPLLERKLSEAADQCLLNPINGLLTGPYQKAQFSEKLLFLLEWKMKLIEGLQSPQWSSLANYHLTEMLAYIHSIENSYQLTFELLSGVCTDLESLKRTIEDAFFFMESLSDADIQNQIAEQMCENITPDKLRTLEQECMLLNGNACNLLGLYEALQLCEPSDHSSSFTEELIAEEKAYLIGYLESKYELCASKAKNIQSLWQKLQ